MSIYVIDALRSPIGRYRGALSGVRPDDLAAQLLPELFRRNPQVDPAQVDDVIMGAANQAGEDNRNVARMAWLLAGLPLEVPAATVNRLCGSGLDAVNMAAASLLATGGRFAVAGGVESMSRAPAVVPKPDERLPRSLELADTTIGWRLVNPAMPGEHTVALGVTAENLAREFEITREEQDEFALASHAKAIEAWDGGRFDREVVAVDAGDARVERDEGPRPGTTMEKLRTLRPAFAADGTVTAGNSSSLNDGAAMVLLGSAEACDAAGVEPLAEVVGWATAGVEPARMGIGPVPALARLEQRTGRAVGEAAVVELNEAFAAQALAVLRCIEIEDSALNPLGGAIALGHPLGCSGARLLGTVAHQLAALPTGTIGVATMCIGVGQGIATMLRRP